VAPLRELKALRAVGVECCPRVLGDSEDDVEPGKCAHVPGKPAEPVLGDGSGGIVPALLCLAARTKLLLCHVLAHASAHPSCWLLLF
jgi:hypothetical protein